jgi:hypothetical protein
MFLELEIKELKARADLIEAALRRANISLQAPPEPESPKIVLDDLPEVCPDDVRFHTLGNHVKISAHFSCRECPAIMYSPQSPTAASAMNAQNVSALAASGVMAVTPASGSSSGSGGGSGLCCADFTKVQHRDRGIVTIRECKIGDFILARTGWTEIKQFKLVPQKTFVRFTTHDGASATVTSSHCITAIRDGDEKSVPAARVSLTDFLIAREGYAAIKKIEMVQMEDGRKAVLSCSPDSVFFGGDDSPALALHNLVPIS